MAGKLGHKQTHLVSWTRGKTQLITWLLPIKHVQDVHGFRIGHTSPATAAKCPHSLAFKPEKGEHKSGTTPMRAKSACTEPRQDSQWLCRSKLRYSGFGTPDKFDHSWKWTIFLLFRLRFLKVLVAVAEEKWYKLNIYTRWDHVWAYITSHRKAYTK